MKRQINTPANECYICHRTDTDLQTLFNDPLNQEIKQKYTEFKKMQDEVIIFINQLLLPAKTYLYILKKDLLDNQFKSFKLSTIKEEYNSFEKQIPHLKEFCKYFNIDMKNYPNKQFRGDKLHLGDHTTLNGLLNELEKDLEALEAISIPERLLNLLNLTLDRDEDETEDDGYGDYWRYEEKDEEEPEVGIEDLRAEMKKYLQHAIKDMKDEKIDGGTEKEKEHDHKIPNTSALEKPTLSSKAKIIIKVSFLMKEKIDKLLQQYKVVNFKLNSHTVTIQTGGSSPNIFEFNVKICPICHQLLINASSAAYDEINKDDGIWDD